MPRFRKVDPNSAGTSLDETLAMAFDGPGKRLVHRLIKHKSNAEKAHKIKGLHRRGSAARKKLAGQIRKTRSKFARYGGYLLNR